jgi:hypothetical protein
MKDENPKVFNQIQILKTESGKVLSKFEEPDDENPCLIWTWYLICVKRFLAPKGRKGLTWIREDDK